MSININIKRTLDDEFVSDVLITAFDGSVGACWYWAEWSDGLTPALVANNVDTGHSQRKEWTCCFITEREEPGVYGSKTLYAVAGETIEQGIQRILNDDTLITPYIRQYVLTAVLEGDAGEIDAEAADCIVQIGLFNKIVFG